MLLLALFGLVLVFYTGKLFSAQIIETKGNTNNAKTFTTYTTVKGTRGEILEAIDRGATTVDGVKRRVGAGMGRCQGSRCGWKIAKILRETGVNPDPLF